MGLGGANFKVLLLLGLACAAASPAARASHAPPSKKNKLQKKASAAGLFLERISGQVYVYRKKKLVRVLTETRPQGGDWIDAGPDSHVKVSLRRADGGEQGSLLVGGDSIVEVMPTGWLKLLYGKARIRVPAAGSMALAFAHGAWLPKSGEAVDCWAMVSSNSHDAGVWLSGQKTPELTYQKVVKLKDDPRHLTRVGCLLGQAQVNGLQVRASEMIQIQGKVPDFSSTPVSLAELQAALRPLGLLEPP